MADKKAAVESSRVMKRALELAEMLQKDIRDDDETLVEAIALHVVAKVFAGRFNRVSQPLDQVAEEMILGCKQGELAAVKRNLA